MKKIIFLLILGFNIIKVFGQIVADNTTITAISTSSGSGANQTPVTSDINYAKFSATNITSISSSNTVIGTNTALINSTNAFEVYDTNGVLRVSVCKTNGNITAPNLIAMSAGGDNAIAGNIGEYVESLLASGSATSMSSGTMKNVTSISLTAGDWDVFGNVNYAGASATMSQANGGISTTSATLPTDGTEVYSADQTVALSATNSIPLPPKRINVSVTTTVYLVGKISFSAGTVTGFGAIRARRSR